MAIIPTILCGGAGSRLWPVSRDLHPKPFIRLADNQSFLQKAFIRAACIPQVSEILTVTNQELLFKTRDEYQEINQFGVHTSFMLEPFGKNTAAAIASAAFYITKYHDEDTVMLVLAADHLITNQDAFQNAVEQAAGLAQAGKLVTFGIQPDMPETGYGYIETAQDLPSLAQHCHTVRCFIEKPSFEKAQEYLDSGRFLWNSGMFCFTAASVLKHMQQFCPHILEAAQLSFNHSDAIINQSGQQIQLNPDKFSLIPENSFDYAVMEPASRAYINDLSSSTLAVVECDIGWSDIGSWRAMSELLPADSQGNRVEGPAMLHDSHDCYVKSDDRLVGLVGVENLIIVDTPDALLIANKNRTQDVKHVYTELKARGHEVHKLHRTVHRPWGTFTVLEEGEHFKIKRIEVNPGASLSLQMHHHRSEHWIVVSGMARVLNGEAEQLIGTNQSTYIPAGNKHRLENPGMITLVMIEVQSGEYLGEDDIIRFEDNYGRVQL